MCSKVCFARNFSVCNVLFNKVWANWFTLCVRLVIYRLEYITQTTYGTLTKRSPLGSVYIKYKSHYAFTAFWDGRASYDWGWVDSYNVNNKRDARSSILTSLARLQFLVIRVLIWKSSIRSFDKHVTQFSAECGHAQRLQTAMWKAMNRLVPYSLWAV